MRQTSPRELRKVIQGLIILTLLAWATQTLVAQWGFGDELQERFIAPRRIVALELKSDAEAHGNEIRLNQIIRSPGLDTLDQTGDLIISRFDGKSSRVIDLDEVNTVLEGAGINLGSIDFSGALRCIVSRTQAAPEPIVEQPNKAIVIPTTRPSDSIAARTLRDLLVAEIAERFALPLESLQVRFSPADEKFAALSELNYRFEIEPRRNRNIGDITWDVALVTATGKQKISVSANVRAWQNQIIATKPIVARQVIGEADVAEKRTLVDRLPEEGTVTLEQVVGQQSARDISPGVVVSGRMIEAVQFAKVGQLVNVIVQQGHVQLKWVAEARESGAFGQSIRVRKPGTRDEFSIVLTGPQQGKLVSASPSNVAVIP